MLRMSWEACHIQMLPSQCHHNAPAQRPSQAIPACVCLTRGTRHVSHVGLQCSVTSMSKAHVSWVQGSCPTPDNSQKRWTLASYEETPTSSVLYGGGLYASEINLMKTLSHQPAAIYIEANADFQFYSYGKMAVASGYGCSCSSNRAS